MFANLISDFESKAGNNLELFTTKLNKPEANEAFSKAVQALGFDAVIQKEAAVRDGEMSNTYGIFKNTYANLLQDNQKETNFVQNETGNIQPERTGDGRTARPAISKNAPLEGAPTIQGATGPDPELVSVAEKYADENNIDLKRQGEYVELDEERAKRLADAYEQMADDPQNPKVKEAYAELIKQTKIRKINEKQTKKYGNENSYLNDRYKRSCTVCECNVWSVLYETQNGMILNVCYDCARQNVDKLI
jgi:hypothetical protein